MFMSAVKCKNQKTRVHLEKVLVSVVCLNPGYLFAYG